jgi:hypothetical protein
MEFKMTDRGKLYRYFIEIENFPVVILTVYIVHIDFKCSIKMAC